MSGIHTSVLRESHPYTRSESPWILEEHQSVYGKLIHYIAGGGMEAFGRTVKQEEVPFGGGAPGRGVAGASCALER